MNKFDFLHNRIKWYSKKLTHTQKQIAQVFLEQPDEMVYLTLEKMAFKCNTSVNAIYRFLKALSFNDIHDWKSFIEKGLKKQHSNFLISESIQASLHKIKAINWDAIINDFNSTKNIIFIAKGSSIFIAGSIARKFKKIGKNTIEIFGTNNYDLIDHNQKYIVIHISISGKGFSSQDHDFIKLTKHYPSMFISSRKPIDHTADNFKYLLYGKPLIDFAKIEKEFPLNSEVITLTISNYLFQKVHASFDKK